MGLTKSEINTLVTIEQASAVVSMTSTAFVIITFCAMRIYRTPSNTLIFYASLGNILSNVAHLIGVAGIADGPDRALCQTQGFLLQMNMPADSLWSLAMAFNVYLTVFRRYDVESLKRMQWMYFIICYGVPFVPAFTYLVIDITGDQGIYGNATLWCWISDKWATLRVVTYYAPIWIVILTTFGLYAFIGKDIHVKRKRLRSLSLSYGNPTTPKEPFGGTQVTQVEVTRTIRNSYLNRDDHPHHDRPLHSPALRIDPPGQYSVTISSDVPTISDPPRSGAAGSRGRRQGRFNSDAVTWAYTKCALLLAASLLITWFPASVNRLYSFTHAGSVSYPLNILSALLLPLQGFWNAIIYFSMSVPTCKSLLTSMCTSIASPCLRRRERGALHAMRQGKDSDSTIELSHGASGHVSG